MELVDSTDYDVANNGSGKPSTERIGGGAVLGAIISVELSVVVRAQP